jgi:cysteate synthase
MKEATAQPADTRHYSLRCLKSGITAHDRRDESGAVFPLSAAGGGDAFLRTDYQTRRLHVGSVDEGVYRFSPWLPIETTLNGSGTPITFSSTGLGPHLGISDLHITFSGWWPERGAYIPTGTFKECEAYAVYGRMGMAAHEKTLVVASAGNTARAFLRVAAANNLPLVVVVPEANIPELWTVGPRSESTVVVAAGDGSDYGDAIRLAALLCESDDFLAEGGAKNVARRDGMGTTYLSAATEIGRTPDHYFQAVGSGTGAIAAWEANLRLLADGRYSSTLSKLHLAQNAPFTVLVDSWNARSRKLLLPDEETARDQISRIKAKVLANRRPPWSPIGGLFDALTATEGEMYAVENDRAEEAAELVERLEGIDPSPAASIAVGALLNAVDSNRFDRRDIVSLNLTGGGYAGARRDLDTYPLTADIVAGQELFDAPAIARAVHQARQRKQTGDRRSSVCC